MGLVRSMSLASVAIFSAAALPGHAQQSSLQSLEQLRWQNRIILVANSNGCDAEIARLEAAKAEVEDRDILWFAICGEDLTTNYRGTVDESFGANISTRYFEEDQTGVVLIGKDGGTKNRASSLDLLSLNQQIDAMPMRKREMRERSR